MISVRESVFETNSSSCHCLTTIPKEELVDFSKNRHHKCVYLPDTGDYQTGDKYEIISTEEAFKRYNDCHKAQNKIYQEHGWNDMLVVTYPEDEDGLELFENDLEEGRLVADSGKYLSFRELMEYIIIHSDLQFDVTWWNNC